MVSLIERINDFVVLVNNYPYYRTEIIDSERGITRVYGRDGSVEKINYVTYKKPYYTKEYLEEHLIPKYERCPICEFGRDIQNLKFKYSKKNNKLYSNTNYKNNEKRMMPKIDAKKALNGVVSFFKQPDVAGQGLAQIPKFAISLFSTELGNKVWNSLIGVVGNIVNENVLGKKIGSDKQALLRALFTNMMFTFADPTANQLREMKRNIDDLVGGLKMKNFGTAFGALTEEPQEVVGAIRAMLPNSGLKGFRMPSLKGAFRRRLPTSNDKVIQAVDTSAISTYKPSYGNPLDDSDIVDY
ncbi:MAG: hypothetical protein ACFFG0_53380 [Candidatus Thorarchaeota archaeon]